VHKVTGKAMAAAVHSNVGLFHATMAIFNAWCDRQPVVVLGATGPVDAAKRRQAHLWLIRISLWPLSTSLQSTLGVRLP
jgi:thiamine pyrophosphate-dependent acetolactate synthase large subunit-like protein